MEGIERIITHYKDVTYEVFKFLDALSLFRLASISKKLRGKVEEYYRFRKFEIAPIDVNMDFYDSFCRITLRSHLFTVGFKVFDLSRNKSRNKARDRMCKEFRFAFENIVILPTLFHPLLDGIIEHYLRLWNSSNPVCK